MTDFIGPSPIQPVIPESPFAPATTTMLQNMVGGLDPTQLIPGGVQDFLSVGDQPTPRVIRDLPANIQALQNKVVDLKPLYDALPPEARNALLDLDSDRVAAGSKPLTRSETLRLAKTWVNQQPATEAPERKPLNVLGNALSDLGTIVKSIPQIPNVLVNELRSLGQMGENDTNAITQLASAPGVRMLPGAFIVENLAEGDVRELISHPLFTALDALPAASAAAKTTKVGQIATEAAQAAGKNPRPLAAFLTKKVGEEGELVNRALPQMGADLRDTTRIGQRMQSVFGLRDVNRQFDAARVDVMNALQGIDVLKGFDMNEDVLREGANRAVSLREKYIKEHGWTEDDFLRVTEAQKVGLDRDFTPVELAYKNEFDEITSAIGTELVRQTDELDFIDGEFYPTEQAVKLREEYQRMNHYMATERIRNEWRGGGFNMTPDDLREATADAMSRRPTKPGAQATDTMNELRYIINVMDRYGYDVGEARSIFRAMKRKGQTRWTLDDINDAIRRELDKDPATLRPRASAADIAVIMKNAARTGKDIQADRLAQAIARGDAAAITNALTNIKKRKSNFLTPELIDDITAVREQFREDAFGGKRYTRRNVEQARSRYLTAQANTPPARFGPLISKLTKEGVSGTVMNPKRVGTWDKVNIRGAEKVFADMESRALGRSLTPDEVAEITRKITESDWGTFRFGDFDTVRKMYADIETEVARTWTMLRDMGHNPSFVHHVNQGKVRATLQPKIGPTPVSLSQVKERAIDMSSGIRDSSIAISHQAVEILSRRASEQALAHVLEQYGVTERQLRDQYRVPAREAAEADPLWGFEGHMKAEIDRRYAPLNLQGIGFNWKSAILDKFAQDNIYVPKAVHRALADMTQPGTAFGALLDPLTNTFRVAVVGLSPRTHLYNVLGGATMLMGETGPGAFRYAREALRMARNPELAPVALRRVIGSQRALLRDFSDLSDASEKYARARAIANIHGGRTLGRLWESIRQSKAAKGLGKAVDFSYDWNGYLDDMYRAMAYLYRYDKSLTKGMSKEVAERAGIETMQKVMMDFGGMSAVERSVAKSILPFYSFMNHAIRYVFRYPVDHPLRAGVVAAFGRMAEDDLDSLLPNRFLGSFFFGSMNDDGGQRAANIAPINPFGDVANMMTFAGFLSATNPAISTVLESVGLVQGEGELYPSLRYNPESGRLEGVRTNPLLAFTTNVIPQSELALTLLGANTTMAERIRRDPEGASRMLLSGTGLPILWREYNVPQEVYRAELARGQAQQNTLNDALRSGNWQNANRYPGLAGVQEQVQNLPPELLSQFTPPASDSVRAQMEALLAGQVQAIEFPDGLRGQLDLAITPTQATVANGGI